VSFRPDLGSGMDGRPDLGSRRPDLWPPAISGQIWPAWVSQQEIRAARERERENARERENGRREGRVPKRYFGPVKEMAFLSLSKMSCQLVNLPL
jgi:hypothetical protein